MESAQKPNFLRATLVGAAAGMAGAAAMDLFAVVWSRAAQRAGKSHGVQHPQQVPAHEQDAISKMLDRGSRQVLGRKLRLLRSALPVLLSIICMGRCPAQLMDRRQKSIPGSPRFMASGSGSPCGCWGTT